MIVCFDVDGTIVDSLAVEAVYYVGAYRKMGIDLVHDIEDIKELCRDNYFEECARRGISLETCRRLGEIYRADLATAKVELPLFDGAAELLNKMGASCPLYIVSNNQSEFIAGILKRCGVTGVTEIIGGDKEPSKAKAFAALRQRHPCEPVAFACDTRGDVLEAKAAGVDSVIAVTYGWGLRADLEEAGADALVDSIPELDAELRRFLAAAAIPWSQLK